MHTMQAPGTVLPKPACGLFCFLLLTLCNTAHNTRKMKKTKKNRFLVSQAIVYPFKFITNFKLKIPRASTTLSPLPVLVSAQTTLIPHWWFDCCWVMTVCPAPGHDWHWAGCIRSCVGPHAAHWPQVGHASSSRFIFAKHYLQIL